MARLQIDLHKGSREWEGITFSDVETVRGLIRFRTRFDLLFERNQYNIMEASTDLSSYEEEVLCTYADLDNLINKVKLNEVQNKVLELYMRGYDEIDIAEELYIKEVTVNSTINTICKRIVEENYEQWKSWVYWDKKRVTNDYKKCSKCEEMLPMNEEYFSPDKRNLDGLHSNCKKCRLVW